MSEMTEPTPAQVLELVAVMLDKLKVYEDAARNAVTVMRETGWHSSAHWKALDRKDACDKEWMQAVAALYALDPAPLRAQDCASALSHLPPAEPERALVTELEILRRGWERDAIVIYAQETVRGADGSTTWRDNECRTEHDTLRRCIAELAAVTQPTPEPDDSHKVPQAEP